jgi:hypothetical protein
VKKSKGVHVEGVADGSALQASRPVSRLRILALLEEAENHLRVTYVQNLRLDAVGFAMSALDEARALIRAEANTDGGA